MDWKDTLGVAEELAVEMVDCFSDPLEEIKKLVTPEPLSAEDACDTLDKVRNIVLNLTK